MLRTIQILALVQGAFLLIILFVKRENYKRLNFWLFFTAIVSLLLHIIGDDEYNLLQTNANWYVFHSPLIITLFYLLIKYHTTNEDKFKRKDFLYFIPYVVFVGLQVLENIPSLEEHIVFKLLEGAVTLTMMVYLVYTILGILKSKKDHWMLFFMIPYAFVSMLDSGSFYITGVHDSIPFLESYGIIGISTILLYIILFKLVMSPKEVLPKAASKGYKTSGLNQTKIKMYKNTFIKLINNEKLYRNHGITVNEVAKKMGIPRQYLSEVLNVHMKSNFQDYINTCRIKEFVQCLESRDYDNYTLIGIANEVGFKSKSSFNTAFKKIYGITPSEYKKSLLR